MSIPLNGDNLPNAAAFRIEDRPAAPHGQEPQTSQMDVSPDFFNTLSIPPLEGRLLDARDRLESARTIVVNESFERRFFPNENPIGRRISIGTGAPVWLEIVGVVGDVRQNGLDRSVGRLGFISSTSRTQAPDVRLSLMQMGISKFAHLPMLVRCLRQSRDWSHQSILTSRFTTSRPWISAL